MDPKTLGSIRFKTRKLAGGPKFDTSYRGLKPKAMGLHLGGVRGDTVPRMLAATASWA